MKNSKVKLLSVWCVVIMVATVFSVAITNVAAQKNSEKRIESPNPDVAIDRYTHIVWQENLTENFEIHYTNNAAIGNYEKTLGSMKKDLESFKEPEAKKALKNLDEALEKCLEKDYKHAIDRTHEAIKNLEKVNRTETTNILKALIDSIRDFAKTNLLYVEYDLSFSNSYVQEAWCKYYLAIKKYAESNYDAATMQFKNSYLKLVEGYEAIGKSFTGHDFGKIVRVSYTNYDSVNPQIFLNDGTVNVGWKEIMDTRPHVDYAKSINDGITWWYFDATEQASTYLCYVGIDPYTVTIENTINIVRALERIWIIDGCHFFYAPIARDGFTIEDRKVFAPLNDPYLELYAGRYEIIYIGERKLYLICGPGPLPVPPPRAPDLTIASISFLTGIPKEGEQINISVTIKNEGDANTSGTIPVKLFDSNIEIGKIDVSSLQINETKSVQFSGALSPGNRVITATIDPDNILAEGNESNNNLEDRLFILYKWMGVGNYFEFMTNIVSVINGTENASIVKCAIEIAGVTSATMLIKEIYSSNETKFSLNTTYSLTTRKEPRENFSAWLWINNDDLTRGYIQVGYETLTYINTTENYHVFEWSQPPKNKSTFYYSKTDNCLALAEEYRITQNQEGRNIIVNTTSIRSESGFRERLPEKIDIITEKSSEERVPRSEYSQTLDKASSNSEVIIFSDNINTLSAWTVVGTGGTSALFTDEMDSLSAWTVSGASTTSPIFTSYVENLLWCDVSGQVTTTTVFSDSFSSLSDWSVTPSVLFSDNFNDGIADGWTPTGGTWTVENGEYSQSNKDVDVYSFAGSIDWKNYIYEARVIIKEKKYSTSWVSLTYGVLDENNLYTFTIRDGYYWVGYRKEGEWYNGWIAKSDIDVDIWNTMKIKFTSETITAWLNDELLGSYSYPTSFRTSGKIGFRCWAAYAHFDDVIVKEEWSLSSAQYYSSPYSVKCTQNPEYGNNIDTYLTRSVSLGGYTSVTLSFY
ncbi:MAG: CARDB domain-containing protein, partial [Candidatus Thermoplasmatota archaeon]